MNTERETAAAPLVAVTMGDPAGVGPETIVGAWRDPRFHALCRACVVGRPAVLRRAAALLGAAAEVVEIQKPGDAPSSCQVIPCLVSGDAEADQTPPATIDPRGGESAYQSLLLAARLALAGEVQAIITAPLHKAALHAAGRRYPGHTELLAELCGVGESAMMLYLAKGGPVRGRAGLGVVHVTLHMALREVFSHLTVEAIAAKTELADAVMRAMLAGADELADRDAAPRIGVAALNPHGGEQGLFGDEEIRVISPAVQRSQQRGLLATGPLPCDTLLVRAAAGEFDAVVAMYHDQGHIALKLLGMHRAVNITLGLPIIRTSVAHGTAFDVAWQGRAECAGMIEAVRAAAQLVRSKDRLVWRRESTAG